jgi:hypothetical protein
MVALPYLFLDQPMNSDAWKLSLDLVILVEAINALSPSAPTLIFIDTSGGPQSFDLPTDPVIYQSLTLKDSTGNARTNNVMVTTTDDSLIDGQPFFMLDSPYAAFTFTWNGTGWSIT